MRSWGHVIGSGHDRLGAMMRWMGPVVIAACVAAPAWAQYNISRFTVDGGGGRSLGGSYELVGTIGQPDAGLSTGASFSLGGGFWAGGSAVVGVGDGDDEARGFPLSFRLHAAAPNPLVRSTVIAFDLPEARWTRLLLYNAAGRLVRTLAEGSLPAGRYQKVWDATDDAGRLVVAGIYFVRFEAGSVQSYRKVVVLR